MESPTTLAAAGEESLEMMLSAARFFGVTVISVAPASEGVI